MSSRISSFGQSNYITNQILRLEGSYGDATTQSSSGLKSQTFSGIAGSTQNLLNLETQFSSITTQTTNAQDATYKINSISSALSGITDILTSARQNLSSAISNNGSSTSSGATESTELQSYLDELVGTLNTQYSGKYIFAGSADDKPPVDVHAAGYTGLDGTTPNTSYYQGNTTVSQVAVTDTLTVSYGITADSSAFEQALRALSIAIANPADVTTLQNAYNLLDSAASGIGELSSITSTRQNLLNSEIAVNQNTLNYLSSNISSITDADLTSLSQQLANEKTQLDASYTSLSNLLKLRLTDFLH